VLIELDPVDRITTDAVGPAGQRTFYLQGRRGDQLVTLLVEKQQVQLLSASVVEILAQIGKETGQGPSEGEMGLDEPIIPAWRAGRLSIGYHDERDLLMLEAEELLPEEEEEEEETVEEAGEPGEGPDAPAAVDETAAEPQRVRFWATREQMLSLARHGANVCAAGRPLCPFCHNPLDPEGHQCPAMNGHRRATEA
jgi:uncharacterized repeat protein (TIGR03847 family)